MPKPFEKTDFLLNSLYVIWALWPRNPSWFARDIYFSSFFFKMVMTSTFYFNVAESLQFARNQWNSWSFPQPPFDGEYRNCHQVWHLSSVGDFATVPVVVMLYIDHPCSVVNCSFDTWYKWSSFKCHSSTNCACATSVESYCACAALIENPST